jgi:CRISPR system Cascade subunit CasE
MILSRLTLNPRSREAARDLADCQELHRTILSAFPEGAGGAARERFGILFRVEYRRGALPALLLQSRETPDWSKLPRGYLSAPPESKVISAALEGVATGAVFRFRLRANPARKIESKSGVGGLRRNGRRVELRTEEQQLNWLRRKGAAGGFELVSVQTAAKVPNVRVSDEGKVGGFRTSASGTSGKRRLTFASVLFEGKLRVTDAEEFRATLEHGVGSAKAYGFGLLSIAPA